MKTTETMKRMMIFIVETDRHKGTQLSSAILERLRKEGCPGATLFQGAAGFGSHGKLHTTALLDLASSLPQMIMLIDNRERIETVRPILEEMIAEGLIVVDDVEVTRLSK